ncbi:hypothetical protein B1B_13687 [mine drainage metagenome]|uniref:Uncharacterized protein n=1 Tax=mine drainage metagenome TaxID=410659 RepID=T0Z6P9_9ZZZZ
MGEAAHPCVERRARDFVAGIGVTRRDDDAALAKLCDQRGFDPIRRQRDQRAAVSRRGHQLNVRGVDAAKHAWVMHALACGRNERPFDMNAKYACDLGGDRLAHRTDSGAQHLALGADQRRQHAGGAEAAVRAGDVAQGCHVGCVVEQNVAAAIDLQINEARREHLTAQIDRLAVAERGGFGAHHVENGVALQTHGEAGFEAAFGEYTRIEQRLHVRVSP